jgi:hypothetical protein
MNAVVGGLASVAGGGKFANGAVTGAFAYLTSTQPGSQPQPAVAQDGEIGNAYAQVVAGYDTPERAAIAALQIANPMSIADAVEYGGMIYRLPSGRYDFSGPITDNDCCGVTPVNAGYPDGATIVGEYHTHSDYAVLDFSHNFFRTGDPLNSWTANDSFSPSDQRYLDDMAAANAAAGNPGYKGYLGTPSGYFKVYDPATGFESLLSFRKF